MISFAFPPFCFQLNLLYGAILAKLGAFESASRANQRNAKDPKAEDLLYQATLSLAQKELSQKQYSSAQRHLAEAETLRHK